MEKEEEILPGSSVEVGVSTQGTHGRVENTDMGRRTGEVEGHKTRTR